MSDPRITPDPALITGRKSAQIVRPVVDLCRRPDGPRDRQVLFGDAVTVLHQANGWSYIQSTKDTYCGHVRSTAIGPAQPPTHKVAAAATHVYAKADFKSADKQSLSHASKLTVTGTTGAFAVTSDGYIPTVHLSLISEALSDPASVAGLFLGTPYLWGGNSRWGVDCSGLVQAALLACAIPCPGDSDMQMELGQDATGPFRRNDLLFWKGHVALVTDENTLIHANAHSMSTTYEPINAATRRIAEQGDGQIIAHRRL